MSRNITINIDACYVRIDPSTGGWVNLSFDMMPSDIEVLIRQFKEVDVLDCIQEDEIVNYLRDKGYNVTEE